MAINRRRALGTLGASALLPQAISAATPVASPETSPVASPAASSSITRDAYYAALADAFDVTEPAKPGGTLIFGESTDIQTVNPIVSSDSYSGIVIRLMFNYLVRASAIDGLPAPDLADSWDVNSDGTVYTFHLNPNATWHDGEPVTAEDVAFSFEVTVAEKSPSPRSWTVSDVVDSFRVVDDHTFEITTKGPRAQAVSTFGLVGIIPKHIWGDTPLDEFWMDPGSTGTDPARVIGSGPFTFGEWVLGDHIELRRNEKYWDPARIPNLDAFYYRVIPDATSITNALVVGDVHVSNIDLPDMATLQDNPNVNLTTYDTLSVNWFDMMLDPERCPFFVDQNVRQALMYALDRQLVADSVYQGLAVASDGFFPPLHVAYDPASIRTPYRQDVDKANALLDEAGWVDTDGDGIREKDGQPFSFECVYSEGAAVYNVQLPYMQECWRAIGVDAQIKSVPFPTLSDMGKDRSYQMRVRSYTWNVDGGLGVVFNTDAIETGYNSMVYSNAAFDKVDNAQVSEMDAAKRIAKLQECNNIVNDDVAAGPLVFSKKAMGSLARVHNLIPTGHDGYWSIPLIWMDPEV